MAHGERNKLINIYLHIPVQVCPSDAQARCAFINTLISTTVYERGDVRAFLHCTDTCLCVRHIRMFNTKSFVRTNKQIFHHGNDQSHVTSCNTGDDFPPYFRPNRQHSPRRARCSVYYTCCSFHGTFHRAEVLSTPIGTPIR